MTVRNRTPTGTADRKDEAAPALVQCRYESSGWALM